MVGYLRVIELAKRDIREEIEHIEQMGLFKIVNKEKLSLMFPKNLSFAKIKGLGRALHIIEHWQGYPKRYKEKLMAILK